MRTIGAVIFPDFELLDLFGPLEMFGMMREEFSIGLVAQTAGSVASRQGPRSLADHSFEAREAFDIVLVPGGPGTRREVDNTVLTEWLASASEKAELVLSVCTGSALLARAGVLDARKATTNKAAFHTMTGHGPDVIWQREARWVEDGKFFTSSGVSAGIDMSLAVIAKLHGQDMAEKVAQIAEYDWRSDPNWDPFAAVHGLV